MQYGSFRGKTCQKEKDFEALEINVLAGEANVSAKIWKTERKGFFSS